MPKITIAQSALQNMEHPVVVKEEHNGRRRKPVVVSISHYGKGGPYLDLRKFYEKGGEYAPTKQGVRVDVADAPELLAAIAATLNARHGGELVTVTVNE